MYAKKKPSGSTEQVVSFRAQWGVTHTLPNHKHLFGIDTHAFLVLLIHMTVKGLKPAIIEKEKEE